MIGHTALFDDTTRDIIRHGQHGDYDRVDDLQLTDQFQISFLAVGIGTPRQIGRQILIVYSSYSLVDPHLIADSPLCIVH
jgi:hypothetical protein